MREWPLYLYGGTGRGKTCAALAFCDHVPKSVYRTAEDLVQWTLHSREDWWQSAKDAVLVVVDELGLRSRDSDLEYRSVKRMSDLREHRPAIWISNHPPEQIRHLYDDRIASRILCGTWYELIGKDRRIT